MDKGKGGLMPAGKSHAELRLGAAVKKRSGDRNFGFRQPLCFKGWIRKAGMPSSTFVRTMLLLGRLAKLPVAGLDIHSLA